MELPQFDEYKATPQVLNGPPQATWEDAPEDIVEAHSQSMMAVETLSQPVPVEMASMTMTAELLDKMLTEEAKKRVLISRYVRDNLVEGTDWGTIKMGGRDSKPCLFKPGSEKICSLLHLKPIFQIDKDLVPLVGAGEIPYICQLINRHTGEIEGEGRGSCSIQEKKNNVNVAIKIAEKRAQLDAVLRVAALSDMFTQDLDDMGSAPQSERAPQSYAERPRPIPSKPPVLKEIVSFEERCRNGMNSIGFTETEVNTVLRAYVGKHDVLYRNLIELHKTKAKDPKAFEVAKMALLTAVG